MSDDEVEDEGYLFTVQVEIEIRCGQMFWIGDWNRYQNSISF